MCQRRVAMAEDNQTKSPSPQHVCSYFHPLTHLARLQWRCDALGLCTQAAEESHQGIIVWAIHGWLLTFLITTCAKGSRPSLWFWADRFSTLNYTQAPSSYTIWDYDFVEPSSFARSGFVNTGSLSLSLFFFLIYYFYFLESTTCSLAKFCIYRRWE